MDFEFKTVYKLKFSTFTEEILKKYTDELPVTLSALRNLVSSNNDLQKELNISESDDIDDIVEDIEVQYFDKDGNRLSDEEVSNFLKKEIEDTFLVEKPTVASTTNSDKEQKNDINSSTSEIDDTEIIDKLVEKNQEKAIDGHDSGNKAKKVLSAVFLTLSVLMLIVSCWLAINKKTVIMNYNMPTVDVNAIKTENFIEPSEELPEGTSGGAVTYMEDVEVSLKNKSAKLMFENPSNSHLNVVLHLMVDDVEIGTSGLIEPGYKIETIKDMSLGSLKAGDYDGLIKLDNYNPETGEKAIVDLEIEVKIHVNA